ncbi:acyltransferase family protein [Vibrio tasmaniensis]|uniref:acyltransferase family protein n=1 Tax=Vibrio tasmaniensis TaxID=212663 RepID=UPI0010820B2B|nr:acyltransferase family protein [Vibrio tasmaniensis]
MSITVMNKINNEIAFLRAFAVLIVLGYHFFPSYLPLGFLGVDIFFVISGYLMVSLIYRERYFGKFIVNRVNRLIPPLLICIFLYYILGYQTLLGDEFSILIDSSIWSIFQVQNIYEYFRDGYFVGSGGFRPYLNFWSLSVEVQIYFVIGCVYIYIFKEDRSSLNLKVLLSLIIIGMISYCVYSIYGDPFFITPFRAWEFFAGCLVFHLINDKPKTLRKYDRKTILLLFLVAIIAFYFLIFTSNTRSTQTLLTVFLVCFFICYANINGAPNFLKKYYFYIGSISYSIYLFHFPAIEFMKIYVGSPTIMERIYIICIVFVIAHIVDRNFQQLLINRKLAFKFSVYFSAVLVTYILMSDYFKFDDERSVIQNNKNLINNTTFTLDYNEQCHYLKGEYIDERCRTPTILGDKQPNFVIIGDSLSNSMTTMFDYLGKENSWYKNYIQFGKGSCPVVLDSKNIGCQKFSEDVINKLIDYDDTTLIITAQWSLYSKEEIQSLKSMISKLKSKERDIILSFSVPLGARPRTCIDRGLIFDNNNCDTPEEISRSRSHDTNKEIISLLEGSGVKVFDPSEYFCKDEFCKVSSNDSIFYLDDSHLTHEGGRYLGIQSKEWWNENLLRP